MFYIIPVFTNFLFLNKSNSTASSAQHNGLGNTGGAVSKHKRKNRQIKFAAEVHQGPDDEMEYFLPSHPTLKNGLSFLKQKKQTGKKQNKNENFVENVYFPQEKYEFNWPENETCDTVNNIFVPNGYDSSDFVETRFGELNLKEDDVAAEPLCLQAEKPLFYEDGISLASEGDYAERRVSNMENRNKRRERNNGRKKTKSFCKKIGDGICCFLVCLAHTID